MRSHALLAIFKRNLVSYFSSPIGYVFICAFVLLSAVAAFWPSEFFNANLANLEQLNEKLPWILLVFIPAITMGIWSDERRQGTDELLLTLPATDFEVVLGKYLAGLAIYTIALVFSTSNIVVLVGLGDPDVGLLVANYIGYWFAGAAMLAVGVVASFLTRNLTVAFVLGAAFNAPLVFADSARAIVPREGASRVVEGFSVAAQFEDFARGLITLSSVVYFASIVVIALYLCLVLIGRRHWVVRVASVPMSAHYGARTILLIIIAVGMNVVAGRFDVRLDTTSEKLSSLAPRTKALLAELDPERPVFIDAYISPVVPERYVQTRLNLLAMLREVDKRGGDGVVVRINDTERFSREASEAEELFNISAREVPDTGGGQIALKEIHLGVAFMSGLEKVVVPFFDVGIPVEYEVIRSISTVAQSERRQIGVVQTDAKLFGGFDMQTMTRQPSEAIVGELQKQYRVVPVNAMEPISEDEYDVLLVIQPSSLPQPQLDNVLDAIRRGQPTAIFEDPFPFLNAAVPATSEPRRPPGGRNPFQQQQPPPEPKGDIRGLWSLLGVDFSAGTVVWDDYNPYPKIQEFYPEFVFVSPGSGEAEALSTTSDITRGLGQVLLIFSGSLAPASGTTMEFEPLLRTGTESGVVEYDDILQRNFLGSASLNANRRHIPTGQSYVVGARVRGEVASPPVAGDEDDAGEDGSPETTPLDVVVVSDIDVLGSAFFMVRAAGQDPTGPVSFDFDNVTLVLNVLDELAGDDRFIEIRSRRPKHRTLTSVERRTEIARAAAADERRKFEDEFEAQRAEEETRLNEELQRLQEGGSDAVEMGLEIAMKTQVGQNRLQARIEQLERDRDRELERLERDLALEVREVQDRYKLAAVGLPPIPPLMLALLVAMRRRAQERLGVPATRLRGAKPATEGSTR